MTKPTVRNRMFTPEAIDELWDDALLSSDPVKTASAIASMDSLDAHNYAPFNVSMNEKTTLADSAELDIYNSSTLSHAGPGRVEELVIINDSGTFLFSFCTLKFYYDGSLTPAASFSLEAFLTSYIDATTNPLECDHLSISPFGIRLGIRIPIPFVKSLRISITNGSGGSMAIWTMARGKLNTPLDGHQLRFSGWDLNNPVTVTDPGAISLPIASKVLASVISGKGYIAWQSFLHAPDGTIVNFLEQNNAIYLNGKAPGIGILPDIDSSGLEDAYGSSFYGSDGAKGFKQGIVARVPVVGAGADNGFAAGIDYMAIYGGKGIPFSNGFKIQLEQGQRVNHGPTTYPFVITNSSVIYFLKTA